MCFAEEGGARKLPPKPGIPSPEARYQGWLPLENFPRSPVSLPPKPGIDMADYRAPGEVVSRGDISSPEARYQERYKLQGAACTTA